MTILASDELPHAAEASSRWNESYRFGFYDARGDCGGFARLHLSPARGEKDAVVCVFFPDGSAGLLLQRAKWEPGTADIQAGALTCECLEPLQRWRLRFSGEVAHMTDLGLVPLLWDQGLFDLPRRRLDLDLTLQAVHAPVSVPLRRDGFVPLGSSLARLRDPRMLVKVFRQPGRVRWALRLLAHRSYQQTGQVDGSLVTDGQRREFAGAFVRSHSWGLGDWSLPRRWHRFSAQFEETLAFSVLHMELLGTYASAGYVWQEGRELKLASFTTEPLAGRAPSEGGPLAIEIRTDDGKRFGVAARVLRNVQLPVRDGGTLQMLGEGYARFEWEGRTTFGLSEIGERVDW